MQLYKFTPITPRAIASIASGKFWASTLDRLNDPFEDRFGRADGALHKLAQGCGVFCVSRSEPGEQDVLTNPLMWAYYASNHTGIAIGLVPDPDKSPFEGVEYLREEEIARRIAALQSGPADTTKYGASPLLMVAFKYKPLFWKYEQEYRRVFWGGNSYIDPSARINEIVFGFRSRPEDELAVWVALKDGVTYRKAQNQGGRIQIEDYEPPTRIEVENLVTFVVDPAGIDVGQVPEAERVNAPRVRFS